MSIVSPALTGQGIGIGTATVAVSARDIKAITTSRTRGENLEMEGYKFTLQPGAGDVVYTVKGPDTFTSKGKRIPHGPYAVNISAGTCNCQAFASREECPHIPGARKYHSGNRSRRREVLDKQLWALQEVGGDRLRIERDSQDRPLILVFRSHGLAEDEARASLDAGEQVEVVALDLDTALASGRYSGTRHVLRSGDSDVILGVAPNTQQHGQKLPNTNPWAAKPETAKTISSGNCYRCGYPFPSEHDEFIDDFGPVCSCTPERYSDMTQAQKATQIARDF